MELQHACDKDDERLHAFFFHDRSDITVDSVMQLSIPRALLQVADDYSTLLSLFVPEEMRLRGYATVLLYVVSRFCYVRRSDYILLYDVSEQFGCARNIYSKLGFTYTGDGAQMRAPPSNILRNVRANYVSGLCEVCGGRIGDAIYFAFDERFCSNYCRDVRVKRVFQKSLLSKQVRTRRTNLKRIVSEPEVFRLSFDE
jgi:hypothetical protein